MINQIQSWLNGSRNFIVGRALYKQLGKDAAVKAQLATGEHAGTRKMLLESMQALIDTPAVVSVRRNETASAEELQPHSDIVLNALHNEWRPLYIRINYLRHSLDQYGESNSPEAIAARYPIAFEILSLSKQCDAIWEKRDHYLLHGTLPVPDDIVAAPADPIQLGIYLEAVKRNIRRNRAKMKQEGADALYAQLYVNYCNTYKKITGKDYVQKD